MRKTFILAALLFSTAISFSQKRTFPKTKNQITEQDAKSDEFGREYSERPYSGPEPDTAAESAYFLEMEKYKQGKITDPERDIPEVDLEKLFYMDMRDMQSPAQPAKEEKKQPAASTNKKK